MLVLKHPKKEIYSFERTRVKGSRKVQNKNKFKIISADSLPCRTGALIP